MFKHKTMYARRKHFPRTLALLFAFFSTSFLANSLFAEEDRFQVIEDRQNLVTQLRINAEDGEVAISDIFRAVSRMNGYDDAELRDAIPEGRISLNGRGARWTLGAFNRVMKPCMQAHAGDQQLNIIVNRESAQRWINDRKAGVRWAWNKIDWRSETPDYGIEIVGDDTSGADIVVLVHGLNSRPEDLVSFIPLIDSAKLLPATFRYPNDQPIVDSAKLLAAELRELRTLYPKRNVRLLTHSMGGLVARAVLETDLDPGNVSQLIMVAPPNHGSALARVASFMDCYEFFTSAEHRRAGVLVESVSDGLGEANADLAPRSVFLDRLNSQKRNANVRYTILLGTNGPMKPAEMNSLREQVRDYTDDSRFVRFFSSKLNGALNNLDEVIAGKGDGAVSCERGRLEGVKDVVELPFSHANILNPNSPATKKAHAVICDRLSK